MTWFQIELHPKTKHPHRLHILNHPERWHALQYYLKQLSSFDYDDVDQAIAEIEHNVKPTVSHGNQSDDVATMSSQEVLIENACQPNRLHDHVTTMTFEQFKEIYQEWKRAYSEAMAGTSK